jgi:hypothetical protein
MDKENDIDDIRRRKTHHIVNDDDDNDDGNDCDNEDDDKDNHNNNIATLDLDDDEVRIVDEASDESPPGTSDSLAYTEKAVQS